MGEKELPVGNGKRGWRGNSPGERHGHNIVALDYRFAPDAGRATAPGGSFPAARLSCISCHDPHGKYRRLADGSIGKTGIPIQASGSYNTSPDPSGDRAVGVYRLLGGKGYVSSLYDGAPFTADPPAAVSPENYNRPEDRGDTRVAYGKGMSEWCANCHPAQLGGTGGGKAHPAGNNIKFSSAVVANYNAYVASGNLTGNPSTSYTSMVPFEMGTADYALLKGTAASTGGQTAGPGTSSNVMCLSCHRAHASGWDHAMRWNMKIRVPGVQRGITQGSKTSACRHGSPRGVRAPKHGGRITKGRRPGSPPTRGPSATSATPRIERIRRVRSTPARTSSPGTAGSRR